MGAKLRLAAFTPRVAGHGKGNEHARALMVGDAVATPADLLDGQFEFT